MPVETASSALKAPQYFAPGVAGDHGEPIAQYLQVGSYLAPNNLSANAHGKGYSDPNIMIPAVIESVETDGGAFNVREGDHSVDLAATYGFPDHLGPFVMAGFDYFREAPRRLDLDHYDSTNTAVYGPFQQVTANNVTLNFLTRLLRWMATFLRGALQPGVAPRPNRLRQYRSADACEFLPRLRAPLSISWARSSGFHLDCTRAPSLKRWGASLWATGS